MSANVMGWISAVYTHLVNVSHVLCVLYIASEIRGLKSSDGINPLRKAHKWVFQFFSNLNFLKILWIITCAGIGILKREKKRKKWYR